MTFRTVTSYLEQKSGGSVPNGFKWPRQNGIAAHYEIIPQVSMSFEPTNMEWLSSLRSKHCDRSFFLECLDSGIGC